MRYKAFTAVKIQVKVFWVVMVCSVVVGYQHFRSPCCPQNTTQCHNPEDLNLKVNALYRMLQQLINLKHTTNSKKNWVNRISDYHTFI
jgi:hypothetical protein